MKTQNYLRRCTKPILLKVLGIRARDLFLILDYLGTALIFYLKIFQIIIDRESINIKL